MLIFKASSVVPGKKLNHFHQVTIGTFSSTHRLGDRLKLSINFVLNAISILI